MELPLFLFLKHELSHERADPIPIHALRFGMYKTVAGRSHSKKNLKAMSALGEVFSSLVLLHCCKSESGFL